MSSEDNVVVSEQQQQQVPTPQTNPLGRKLTIVFALPGDTFSNNFLLGWTTIFNYCLSHDIMPLITNHKSNNIYYVRNMCLGGNVLRGVDQKPFNGEVKYDFIMWMDSDQVFSVENFVNLLQHDADIMSGLYLMENNKEFATVENMDKEYFKKHGHYEFLSGEELLLRRKKDAEPVIEVDYTGMGWMLVKHGVFEKMQYPWFSPDWQEMDYTDPSGNVFNVREFTMEDVCFCKKAKDLGYKIKVDTRNVVGHEKRVVLG